MEMPSWGDNDYVPPERGSDEEYNRRIQRESELRAVLDETVVFGMKGRVWRAYLKVMGFDKGGPGGVVHATNEEMDMLDEYLGKMRVFDEITSIIDELTLAISERLSESSAVKRTKK